MIAGKWRHDSEDRRYGTDGGARHRSRPDGSGFCQAWQWTRRRERRCQSAGLESREQDGLGWPRHAAGALQKILLQLQSGLLEPVQRLVRLLPGLLELLRRALGLLRLLGRI